MYMTNGKTFSLIDEQSLGSSGKLLNKYTFSCINISLLFTKRVSIHGVWQGCKHIEKENHETHDLLFPSKATGTLL